MYSGVKQFLTWYIKISISLSLLFGRERASLHDVEKLRKCLSYSCKLFLKQVLAVSPADCLQKWHTVWQYVRWGRIAVRYSWRLVLHEISLRSLASTPILLGPVVRKVDNAIHRINHYPLDSAIDFPNTYPLDSDSSDGYRYPTFEQLGPARFFTHVAYVFSETDLIIYVYFKSSYISRWVEFLIIDVKGTLILCFLVNVSRCHY